MNIVALDLSLTSTGYSTPDGSGVLRTKTDGVERLQWLRGQVHALAEGADLVVIEGYAFGVGGQAGLRAIGELGGVIRVTLADHDIRFVEVSPSSLKQFATGKGNAPKEAMLQAAWKKLGYEGIYHDEADALFLREMALTHYGDRQRTDYEARALTGVHWPALRVEAVA